MSIMDGLKENEYKIQNIPKLHPSSYLILRQGGV